MNLKPIASNMNELQHGWYTTLFSYKTPVACRWTNGDVYEYFKTEKKWSRTTSRHINQWLGGDAAKFQPQEYFDNLTSEVK